MSVRRTSLIASGIAIGLGIAAVALLVRWRLSAIVTADTPALRVAAIRDMSYPGSTDLLIKALSDEDADVRLVAAQGLGGRGNGAQRRAEALVKALQDKHAGVRREAAESLDRLGPQAGPMLYQALKDPSPRVRSGAALALSGVGSGKMGRDRSPGEEDIVVPLLCEALGDPDETVRYEAANTLSSICRWNARTSGRAALPALRQALKDRSPKVRRTVVWTLKTLDPQQPATTTAYLNALRDDDAEVREQAASAVTVPDDATANVLSTLQEQLAPHLGGLLHDQRNGVRRVAARTLGAMRTKAQVAVPALQKTLADRDPEVRAQAAMALGQIGTIAREGVPALAAALRDPDQHVRRHAAISLWRIERRTNGVVPILAEALAEEEPFTREYVAQILGEMGPEAKVAVPALLEARRDEMTRVSSAADEALRKVDPKAAAVLQAKSSSKSR